ncbi:MAG: acyl-CoA/acyl-ACP dehydrogenase [Chloroflexi bacterium]|nr:acyl-CoA/acyl-ACP dehydrogenase [Chloroflexota bacterium]
MDLSLTPVQAMIKDAARDFLSHEYPLRVVREIDETETGFSPDLWRRMVELGWVGMVLPAEYGGAGHGFTDAAVLFEELGYYGISSPLHSSVLLGGLAILEAGSAAQQQEILPSVANGSRRLAFALTEADYGWSPEFITLQATPRAGGYALNGTKLYVPDAHIADQVLVVARTSQGASPERGVTLFLVDRGTPGLTVRALSGWTGDRLCQVTFNNVQVPASAVVGPVDGAWAPLQRVLDRATAVLCAYMVGSMQRLFDLSAEYAQNRIHFGVPISTFQRVQDYIIDILNNTDSARWTTYEALWKLDEGRADAPEAVSVAKAVASQGFPKSAQDAHHVHGGMGADKSYGMYLFTKKARTLHSYLGDATYHKHRVAQLIRV